MTYGNYMCNDSRYQDVTSSDDWPICEYCGAELEEVFGTFECHECFDEG